MQTRSRYKSIQISILNMCRFDVAIKSGGGSVACFLMGIKLQCGLCVERWISSANSTASTQLQLPSRRGDFAEFNIASFLTSSNIPSSVCKLCAVVVHIHSFVDRRLPSDRRAEGQLPAAVISNRAPGRGTPIGTLPNSNRSVAGSGSLLYVCRVLSRFVADRFDKSKR